MRPMDLDPSLAWTALFEMDPEFSRLDPGQVQARMNALLAAWYGQEETRNFWDFARAWLAAVPERDAAASTTRASGGPPPPSAKRGKG